MRITSSAGKSMVQWGQLRSPSARLSGAMLPAEKDAHRFISHGDRFSSDKQMDSSIGHRNSSNQATKQLHWQSEQA